MNTPTRKGNKHDATTPMCLATPQGGGNTDDIDDSNGIKEESAGTKGQRFKERDTKKARWGGERSFINGDNRGHANGINKESGGTKGQRCIINREEHDTKKARWGGERSFINGDYHGSANHGNIG